MIDTILVLDVSGSMSGQKLQELKDAVVVFLVITEKLGLGDRIALVTFGGQARLLSPLTNSYGTLVNRVRSMHADGSTPMAEALAYALQELSDRGRIISISDIQLMPRIILMTDGEPDNEVTTRKVAALLGGLGFPIACVGVTGCKPALLRDIASATGGMFVMANKIHELSVFFLQQVYMTLYIAEMKEQLENLLNRELLRAFMEDAMKARIDDATLDLIIAMLASMVKRKGGGSSSRNQRPQTPLLTGPSAPSRQYNNSSYASRSSGCCCTIL